MSKIVNIILEFPDGTTRTKKIRTNLTTLNQIQKWHLSTREHEETEAYVVAITDRIGFQNISPLKEDIKRKIVPTMDNITKGAME